MAKLVECIPNFSLSKEKNEAGYNALIEAHLASGLSPAFTAGKMKELWFYLHCLFPDCARPYKALNKARDLPSVRTCASSLMASCAFEPARGFQPPV